MQTMKTVRVSAAFSEAFVSSLGGGGLFSPPAPHAIVPATDTEAMRGDWIMVGNDLREAAREAQEESEPCSSR